LSFHRVREAIAAAAKIIGFYHVRSEANVSDILSKHWGYQQAWPLLRPLLFWKGDTKDLIDLKEKGSGPHNGGGFYVVDRGLVNRNDNDGGFYMEDQLQLCQLTALHV